MKKNLPGAGFDFDASFAVADSSTQLMLSGGSFHGNGDLRIDVAGTRASVKT